MKKFLLMIAVLIIATALSASVLPYVTLAWDANEEPELKGYSIYIQEDGGAFTWIDDFDEIGLSDPLHPQVIIQGLDPRNFYYFAVTAYSEGEESDFSNLACGKLIPGYDHYVNCDYVEEEKNGDSGGSGGGSGGGCFISATQGG